MDITFDPAKDAANFAKHRVSLADAADLVIIAVVPDDRFAGEQRYRIYGLLRGVPHCLAAVLRDGNVRAISFRRAHLKEYSRYD
jgi:uncharacterized DUF497 family protein